MGWRLLLQGVMAQGLRSGYGTSCDKFVQKCRHPRPPVVLLKQVEGPEESTMSASRGFMDRLYQPLSGLLWDIEAILEIKGSVLKCPVLLSGPGQPGVYVGIIHGL